MTTEQIKEFVWPPIQKYKLPLSLGMIGIFLLGYGLISSSASKSSDTSNVQFDQSVEAASDSAQIMVDVEGAVMHPGVYNLPFDARVKDALVAASGLSDNADRQWVAQTVNLASKITDGQKIYVRQVGEVAENSGSSEGSVASSTGLVNINSAGVSDLDGLPGVGQVTAQKIINGRPYNSVDELLSKKIVSSKVFGEIRDKISIY